MGHPMRIELTSEGLLPWLTNLRRDGLYVGYSILVRLIGIFKIIHET